MYIKNVCGYNFAFTYRKGTIYIPYDGLIYSVPDDIGKFQEFRVIMPMHVRGRRVIYIKVDGEVSTSVTSHKRHGRPSKPAPVVTPPVVKTPVVEEPVVTEEHYTVDVDINDILSADVPPVIEEDVTPPKKLANKKAKNRGKSRVSKTKAKTKAKAKKK